MGGTWPGFSIDNSALPARMMIDYVRVYQSGSTPPPPTDYTVRIEAENYSAMSGVQTEPTSDVGGGQNVGYIDAGDWMVYPVNIPASGIYTVQYRVASPNGGGRIRLDKDAGATLLGEVNVPATGGWQTWSTISHTVNLQAGQQNIGLYAAAGGFNINWINISSESTNTQAINAQEDKQQLKFDNGGNFVYPNPAERELNISSAFDLKGAAVRIIDATGKEVYKGTLNTRRVAVASLPSGLYSIIISKDGEEINQRFIKK